MKLRVLEYMIIYYSNSTRNNKLYCLHIKSRYTVQLSRKDKSLVEDKKPQSFRVTFDTPGTQTILYTIQQTVDSKSRSSTYCHRHPLLCEYYFCVITIQTVRGSTQEHISMAESHTICTRIYYLGSEESFT